MLHRWITKFQPTKWLVAILLIGLLQGLTYVFLIPPWQHYDEPSHFEYVWLVANRPGFPKAGSVDSTMRHDVAASMLEHGFYRDMGIQPNIKDVAASIGYSQLGDPPLYYLAASLPFRLLHLQNVTLQLYAARLISLCFYLAVILTGWGLMGELVPAKHPLKWMVPISLALLPGFIDLMTAVNNGSAAVLVFSLFLWASVRLVRRGVSFLGLLFVFGSTALCFWTANISWIALPLLPVVLLFALLRGKRRPLAWALFLVTIVIGLGATLNWGDAANWYRRTFQAVPSRVVNSLSPLGAHAFRLDLSIQDGNRLSIQQPLSLDTVRNLKNSTVTIGAWIWSSQPMLVQLPSLNCFCGGQAQGEIHVVESGTEPSFHSFTTTVPAKADFVWVTLTTPADLHATQGTIYYDGVVLIKGKRILNDPPTFMDASGKQGLWGGQPFSNLVRNPSAEQAVAGVQSWANKIGAKIIPSFPTSYPSDVVVSLFDWQGSSRYYDITIPVLLRTFWAKFGWGNVPLQGSNPYRILAIFTLLGIIGAGWAIWQRRNELPWDALFLLGLGLLGIWVPAIMRGIGSLFGNPYFPTARYAYPAILPTVLVLNAGWLEILKILGRWPRITPKLQYAIFILLFVILDTLAILAITHHYYLS